MKIRIEMTNNEYKLAESVCRKAEGSLNGSKSKRGEVPTSLKEVNKVMKYEQCFNDDGSMYVDLDLKEAFMLSLLNIIGSWIGNIVSIALGFKSQILGFVDVVKNDIEVIEDELGDPEITINGEKVNTEPAVDRKKRQLQYKAEVKKVKAQQLLDESRALIEESEKIQSETK